MFMYVFCLFVFSFLGGCNFYTKMMNMLQINLFSLFIPTRHRVFFLFTCFTLIKMSFFCVLPMCVLEVMCGERMNGWMDD